MIPILSKRQLGLVNDIQVKQMQSNVKFKKLIPDMLHPTGVTSLDLELSCNRYLLYSTAQGNLYLDDIVKNSSLENENGTSIFQSSHSIETVQYMWDFETFATSGWDKKFRIFDIENLKVIAFHEFDYKIAKHDLNSTKQLCSVTGDKFCYLFDLRRQMIVDIIKQDDKYAHLTNLQWNKQNCNLLLIATEDGLFLWDIRRPNKYLLKFTHPSSNMDKELYLGCTFTKDFSSVISFGANGIYNWDLKGSLMASYYHPPTSKKPRCSHFIRPIQMCLPFYPCKPELVFVPYKNNALVLTIPGLRPFHCYKDSFKDLHWIYNIPNSYNIITGSSESETIIWKPKIKAKEYI